MSSLSQDLGARHLAQEIGTCPSTSLLCNFCFVGLEPKTLGLLAQSPKSYL